MGPGPQPERETERAERGPAGNPAEHVQERLLPECQNIKYIL